MVALVLDGLVGFPAGLSPTSFHLSPSSFHLSPRLGACGRVPGWLVSHFFSFVSQFFSFVSQAGCLWFHLSPSSFHLSPTLLVGLDGLVGFPAGLSPTSFHLSPSSFHLSQVGFPAGLSPTSFHSPIAMLCGLAKLIGGRAPSGHSQWADGVPVMFDGVPVSRSVML